MEQQGDSDIASVQVPKARLVAKGFQEEVDIDEICDAPTAIREGMRAAKGNEMTLERFTSSMKSAMVWSLCSFRIKLVSRGFRTGNKVLCREDCGMRGFVESKGVCQMWSCRKRKLRSCITGWDIHPSRQRLIMFLETAGIRKRECWIPIRSYNFTCTRFQYNHCHWHYVCGKYSGSKNCLSFLWVFVIWYLVFGGMCFGVLVFSSKTNQRPVLCKLLMSDGSNALGPCDRIKGKENTGT